MEKKTTLGFALIVFFSHIADAGNGLYYGASIVSQQLDTDTKTQLIFSSPPPEPSTQRGQRSQSLTDVSLHIGYVHKRRRTNQFFLAPEFFISTLDANDYIYGTQLKAGYDLGPTRLYGSVGVSRIDVFKQNKLQTGLGMEWAFSNRISLSLEWLRFDTLDENTNTISNFGGQNLTTITDTAREIEAINIGVRFYLHE